MQTIKLEKPKKIEGLTEWARGRNGIFKPAKIEIWKGLRKGNLTLYVDSSRQGKNSPIMIALTKENWKKVIVALGEELSQ